MILEELKSLFLQESLLQESVQGEWWIDDNGVAMFADADIGDMSHSAYVMDMVAREILDMFDVDCHEEFCSIVDNMESVFENIEDGLSEEQIARWNDGEEYLVMVEYLGLEGEELEMFNRKVQVVLDHIDPRDYCMQYMGWIRVVDANVQTWGISNHILSNIADGLWDAYESDLSEYEDVDEEFEGQPTFTIEVLSTRQLFSGVPWAVIRDKNLNGLLPYRNRY